jgi:uncharacterized protein YaaW (UPF0174 family)
MDEKKLVAGSSDRLEQLLLAAAPEDIQALVKYNYGESRTVSATELVAMIRENGSNDVGRQVWGPSHYLEIVRNIANRFDLTWQAEDDEVVLEKRLLAKILQQSWPKMSVAEREAVHDLFAAEGTDREQLSRALVDGTFSELLPTLGYVVVWNTARLVAAALAREGGVIAGESFIGGLAAQLLGPLGIVAGVIILLAGLAGPAYRKVIPSVILIAYIRSKKSDTETFMPG